MKMIVHYRNLDTNKVHDLVVAVNRLDAMIKYLQAKNCQILSKYSTMGL